MGEEVLDSAADATTPATRAHRPTDGVPVVDLDAPPPPVVRQARHVGRVRRTPSRAVVSTVAGALAVALAGGWVGWSEGGERGRRAGEATARDAALADVPVTGWIDGFGEARSDTGEGNGVIDASLLVVNAGDLPVTVTDVRVATLLPAQGGPPRVQVEPASPLPVDLGARSSDRIGLTVTADCGVLRPRRTVVEALVQTSQGERWVPMSTSGPSAVLATGVARACRRAGTGPGGLDLRSEYLPRGLRLTLTNGNRTTRTITLEALATGLVVDSAPRAPWRLAPGGTVTVELTMRLATCLPGTQDDVPDVTLRVVDPDGRLSETIPIGGQALVAYGAARQRACAGTRDHP